MSDDPSVTLDAIDGLRRALTLYTYSPTRDLVSQKLHESRAWEPFETRLWLAAQRVGDVVVDVGANLGYYSLLSALSQRPAAAIYAFEPGRDNFALLERNLAVNKCQSAVHAVHAALSDASGAGVLHRSDDNFGDHQIYPGDGERGSEPISLLKGAEFLQKDLRHIDLLKLDTQGSEFAALTGLLPLLRDSGRRLRMLVELTPWSLRLAGSSAAALLELIAGLDLPLFIVDHIEHRLVASDCESLTRWSKNVDALGTDRGFMNIFAGEPPPL